MSDTPVKVPKYLGIYYGWPSLVNNCEGDVTAASNCYAQFDLIVFADNMWKPTSVDYEKTKLIIENLTARGKPVFGYIDLGVLTQNLPIEAMCESVNGWIAIGATGIFWDDVGYDYLVTRERQATMIQYSHDKGVNVFINAWNPDDVFAGENMQLNAGDFYLLESLLVSDGNFMSMKDWKIRADKCAAYQKKFGVTMACVATPKTDDQFTLAWFATAMYNFDYFQTTDFLYSGCNNTLVFTPNPSLKYGTVWKSDEVLPNADQTRFSRPTDSTTLTIAGDGSTWGYGAFEPNQEPEETLEL